MKKYLVAVLVSMIPIVELRGAVPIAMAWGIDWYLAIIVCALGNMLPVPFIYFFARKILNWGANKRFIGRLCRFIIRKGEKASVKLGAKKGSRWGFFIGLVLFVGVPIPGTGAWNGALAASLLNAGFKDTVISVSLGVLMAAIIIAILYITGDAAFSLI